MAPRNPFCSVPQFSFFLPRAGGRRRRNFKSQNALLRRACHRFPATDAREQVVVFMRRHWCLERGRRHGDSWRGRAEEALSSGKTLGRRIGLMGRPRAATRALGRSAGRFSPGGRFGPPATSGGGRDLAGVRRGFEGCSPASSELGAPGFGCGCILMLRCSLRHSEPALRSRVSGIGKCQCAPQKCLLLSPEAVPPRPPFPSGSSPACVRLACSSSVAAARVPFVFTFHLSQLWQGQRWSSRPQPAGVFS